MKKICVICLSVSLLMAVSISAGKNNEVLLKYSVRDDMTRIVFEADEQFVNKAKIDTSASRIRIEFPEPVRLISEKSFPFELSPADKSLTVSLPEKSEIKFFRLFSPARLVFDIRKKATLTEKVERQSAPILSRVFVIDPGHGGYDFGITSGNANEKDISLNLAKDLDAALAKRGKKVLLTRRVDQYMSITERINFVNQKSPDVFISLHSSLSENFVLYSPGPGERDTNETEDLYSLSSKQKKYIGKSKSLADSIESAIKEAFGVEAVRREMRLPLLDSAGAPSVFIELPSPKFTVYDQQMRAKITDAILNGLALYGQQT